MPSTSPSMEEVVGDGGTKKFAGVLRRDIAYRILSCTVSTVTSWTTAAAFSLMFEKGSGARDEGDEAGFKTGFWEEAQMDEGPTVAAGRKEAGTAADSCGRVEPRLKQKKHRCSHQNLHESDQSKLAMPFWR